MRNTALIDHSSIDLAELRNGMATESKKEFKVAIVSDIHAYYEDAGVPPSNLCIKNVNNDPGRNPIEGLHHLFDIHKTRVDLLLCGGDLGDKALPAGIQYVWEKLHVTKEILKAKWLVGTTGNHDMDSRYQYNEYDAKGVLQSLVPPFPIQEEVLRDRYWSRNFAILSEPEYRLVVLNTSAYHGNRRDGEQSPEYNHGRIAPKTVEALRRELSNVNVNPVRTVNILLCHHHPHKYDDIEESDYSVMDGAEMLIKLLGSGDFGEWIIIHGHKHHPRIAYSGGDAIPPIVFSAGSLCAAPYPELASHARNQFHVITFPLDQTINKNYGLVGTFESWDWSSGTGWIRASTNSGLPAYGGFGYRTKITVFAQQILDTIDLDSNPWVTWKDIEAAFPQIKFILPGERELLIKTFNSNNVELYSNSDGYPVQIARKS